MIKKLIFIAIGCIVLCQSPLEACDACGCSASNMGFGLLTDYRNNFIRLGFFDTRFKANADHEFITSDRFVQLDLSIRYALGRDKRIRLMAHLPYSINQRDGEDGHLTEKGLSDARITANYVLFDNLSLGSGARLYLESGGGFSFPTGGYDKDIHERDLPENFNLGSGALGYIFLTNAILNIDFFGLVFSNNYLLNGKTKSGYRFGNQFNSQLTVFREFSIKSFSLTPNIGFGYESISSDRHANGSEVSGTGGEGLFLSSALNFNAGKWLAGVSYSTPLSETYSDEEVTAQGRIGGHVAFIF